ncbi:MAG: hypothetical protein ACLPX5_08390 [Dissulfurispiraceae bacterium]
MKNIQSMCFKTCSKCGFVWPERGPFLSDPHLRIIGYQVDFEELMAGLFLFNHICGTTLSIKAGDFQDLYDGPLFTERLTGSETCGDYCLHKNDLRPCPTKCEGTYVRQIVQAILNWPKQGLAEKQHNGERAGYKSLL